MIRVTTEGEYSRVAFAYDAEAVDIIRTIPCRHWHSAERYWRIETSWVRLLCTRMHNRGFDVTIDGKRFVPDAAETKAHESLLLALFKVLPAELRQGTFKALARIWHPDVSGTDTTELMKQLNQANKRTRQT
jgi:hypothetical protein